MRATFTALSKSGVNLKELTQLTRDLDVSLHDSDRDIWREVFG
jgi:hypothetical protein